MVSGDIEVRVARPDEVKTAWEEMESLMAPQADLWPPAIEAGLNSVLIARKLSIGRAVGTVTVKWTGPSIRDPELIEFVNANYAGEPQATPAVYGLEVQEGHRRQGIGEFLMEALEEEVCKRPEVANRLALTVQLERRSAVRLYRRMGYYTHELITHPVPGEWNEELSDYESRVVDSLIMTKDL